MFKITNVFRVDVNTVRVLVSVDAKHWHACKAKGHLGQLYGVDISNAVFHLHQVKAYNPSVGDYGNARDGLKRFTFDYTDSAWCPAPANVVRVDFKNRKRVA